MILNMGPQHPSTHGVLRVLLEIDGETIVRLMPDIGFLHTGIEKTCEAKFYQQVVPLTDRIDYLCPMTNNLCYVLAVEKLLGLEIPPKAQWMRVLMNELTRINSHLVWLGTHAMDIGALTVFLYCFREREEVLKIFEMVSGQRMMTSYFRVGGMALEPPLGFFDRVRDFAGYFPEKVDEYENLLTGNPIWTDADQGRCPNDARKMRSHSARQGRHCVEVALISTCGATCRIRATRNSSSRYRFRKRAMSSPVTCAVSRNCANRLGSCGRLSMECRKARSRRTHLALCFPTARR